MNNWGEYLKSTHALANYAYVSVTQNVLTLAKESQNILILFSNLLSSHPKNKQVRL